MRKIGLALKVLIIFLLSACGLQSQNFDEMVDQLIDGSVKLIYADSLNKLMLEKSEIVILDARESSEFNVSHLENAQWIGYDNFKLSDVKADKDDRIVIYCSVGYRSEKIGEKLQQAGYRSVSNLHGGIFGWKNRGNKVVNNQGVETEKVHAYNKTWGKWLTTGEKVFDE